MKFSEKLAAHLTPEWRVQYINYVKLKEMIIAAADNAPADTTDWQAIRNYYAIFDDEFFQKCEVELNKINNFFAAKLAESKRKHSALKAELKNAMEIAEENGRLSRFDFNTILPRGKAKDFELAFSELYLHLVLLQNYQTLNHTGFRKILKKHDKLLRTVTGARWFNEHVNSAPFYINHEIMALIRDTEDTVTFNLEGGDRTRAMKRLRVPPLQQERHPWTNFRVGLYLGALTVLTATAAISFSIMQGLNDPQYENWLRLYRAPFLLVLYVALIAINIVAWSKAGINHVLIFELDPRDHLMAVHVMEIAAVMALLLVLSALCYMHAYYLNVPSLTFPLMLLVLMLSCLLNPLRVFHYTARVWLIKLVGRVVASPFFSVRFAEFWLAEQLLSLQLCLLDYEFLICFYFNRFNGGDEKECGERDILWAPLTLCLPAWIRFIQCLRRYRHTGAVFPFLVNAVKYATSFPTIWFRSLMVYYQSFYPSTFDNPFVWGYIICHTIESIYFLIWDMKMDYGLFEIFSGENIFLRSELLYQPSFYYFAILQNTLLRFFWVFGFYLSKNKIMSSSGIYTLHSCLEIFRRYMWNYFRLENEHLFNAGKFRAVRDIFVAPIDPGDIVVLQRLMDEVDGVTAHRADSVNQNDNREENANVS